jgi:hypothetical protein
MLQFSGVGHEATRAKNSWYSFPDAYSYACTHYLHNLPAGTCDINVVLTVELSDEEAKKVVLDANEYSDSKWISQEEMQIGDYHPALKVSARALSAQAKLAELHRAVSAGSGDAHVAHLARELCALTQPPAMGRSTYILRNDELGYEGAVDVSRC